MHMNKIWKIVGIVVGAIVALFILVLFVGSLGTERNTPLGDNSMGTSSFSNPLVGSSGNSPIVERMAAAPDSAAYEKEKDALSQNFSQADKKVIKNGNLSLKVESADEALKKIGDIARAHGGE